MHEETSVELSRDCEATQIPAGTVTTLPAGMAVDITQTLGGSYTVHAAGGVVSDCGQGRRCLGLAKCDPNRSKGLRRRRGGGAGGVGDAAELLRSGDTGQYRGPGAGV